LIFEWKNIFFLGFGFLEVARGRFVGDVDGVWGKMGVCGFLGGMVVGVLVGLGVSVGGEGLG
jgi:hypothetical protein